MTIKCKIKPSCHKLFKRQPTLRYKDCRWIREVNVQTIKQIYSTTYLTVNLDISSDQDRSLASMGCFRDITVDRQAMVRIDNTRVYTFQTSKGYECINEQGEPVEVTEDSIVSIRFTPIIRNNTVYFALECIVVHS